MASPILHIKDSYYFEVPKFLWRSNHESREDFPLFWRKLDPDYQLWEAEVVYGKLQKQDNQIPAWPVLKSEYEHWKHADHHNTGKPFTEFVKSQAWWAEKKQDASFEKGWEEIAKTPVNPQEYKATWSPEKIAGYNRALDGKILVPQIFGGQLKNLYEKESGMAISKFMVIELVVAILLVAVFSGWLAPKIATGARPTGRLWNLLESILLFLRDQVARPAIGHGADKFVPLIWTIFLFVLGCNLFGMLPWAGAPTGAFAVTLSLALVTLLTGWLFGILKFGPSGAVFGQLVPHFDLPIYMAIVLVPMIYIIEVAGTLIKHGVLGVRLLANMVAGHVVLLGIMGLAFSLEGALSPSWKVTAAIAVICSTLFSCLELFVAFLQAYIFAFLSALFIGAATHKH